MTEGDAADRLADRRIRKFNPGTFQADEEVVRQFVVRHRELGIVLEALRGNIDSPSCQHILVVAPRGRGKTMLLARAAAELRTNDEFSARLLAIRFMEETQEVFDVADFWLEVLFQLAGECRARNPEFARDLARTHAALSGRWRDPALHEQARAAVLNAADRLDRKLVLMVENLQALCANVDPDFGWQLRAVLQSEPQIMLLATATTRFEGLDDAEQPFFELFHTVSLEPLGTEDCRRLWSAVSGDSMRGREIRPLQILTGGSPRLLVIVAGFARHRSLRQLMEELVTLIDEHTEYFRGHLEALPRGERRVYVAAIDLWRPSSTGEIAARARMDIRVVSTMLGRLAERGAVVSVSAKGGRKRLYAASEPLYSIYYKLRRERDEAAIVRNLIHFMVAFYDEAELSGLYGGMIVEAAGSAVIREGIERALEEVPQSLKTMLESTWPGIAQMSAQPEFAHRKAAQHFTEEINTAFLTKSFKRVIEIAERISSLPDMAEAETLDSFMAWVGTRKAYALDELGDTDGAIATYDEIIERFGDSNSEPAQIQVVVSLVCKRVVKGNVTESQADLMIYDEMVGRLRPEHVSRDLREKVARSLFNDAATKNQDGDRKAAIVAYGEVVKRLDAGQAQEMGIRVFVARALVDKGITHGQLREWSAALECYNEVLSRFDVDDSPTLQVEVARALFNAGVAHGELGNPEKAIATYNEVVGRFAAGEALEFQAEVARAMFNKGNMLRQLGNPGKALEAYNNLINRFEADDALMLQVPVARALNSKGTVLEQLGDTVAAMGAYEDAIDRFSGSDAPEIQSDVARALFNMGQVQSRNGHPEAAITAYDAVIERFGSSGEADLEQPVSLALVGKSRLQIELGLKQEALRTCTEFERRLDAMNGVAKAEMAWRAACVRAVALMAQGQREGAMDAFRAAYAAFPPDNEVMLREMLGFVQDMIANEASVDSLISILSGDSKKSDLLAPMIVALRQLGGERVREPSEVMEVVADIRKRIEEKAMRRVSPAFHLLT